MLEFLTAAFLMELTPGPNMMWLAIVAAREGRGAGLRAVAGIALGLALLAVAVTAGLAALLASYPAAFEVLRWGGVLFLLYLAFEAWIGGDSEPSLDRPDGSRYFRRGLIINILNPKAVSVFAVLVPGFLPSATLSATLALGLIYVAIATGVHLSIVAFAGNFQKALASPKRERLVRRLFAISLLVVAIWFAITSAKG